MVIFFIKKEKKSSDVRAPGIELWSCGICKLDVLALRPLGLLINDRKN